MTLACSPRTSPAAAPVSPPSDALPPPPSTVVPTESRRCRRRPPYLSRRPPLVPRPTPANACWSQSRAHRLRPSPSPTASIPQTRLARRTRASGCCSVSSTRRWSGPTAVVVSFRAWPRPGGSMQTAAPGSSRCGRMPDSPTARRSRPLTCERAGRATASAASCGRRGSSVQSIALAGDRALAITLRVAAWTCRWRWRIPIWLSPSRRRFAVAARNTSGPDRTGRSSRPVPAAAVITVDRDDLPADSLSRRSGRSPRPPRPRRRPAADAGSGGARLRGHAAAVSVVAAGLAATHVLLTPGRSRSSPSLPRSSGRPSPAMRCEARRGGRGTVLVADGAGLRIALAPPRNQSAPTPRIVYDAATARPAIWPSALSAWPRLGPGRRRVSRRAPSGPSATDASSAPPG